MKQLIVIALFSLGLSSCSKNGIGTTGGTFTVSGTILTSCAGAPVANLPVRADLTGNHTTQSDVYGIGNAMTDANGHFTMKCTAGYAGLLTIGVNGVKYITNFTLNYKYPDLDFKNIYKTVQHTVCIRVIANGTHYKSSDTLFLGSNTIYPITTQNVIAGYSQDGSQFIDKSVSIIIGPQDPNRVLHLDSNYVFWGIGAADYQKATLSGETDGTKYPYYNAIHYALLGCAGIDTVTLSLP